jgi:glyoxylase I family protein
MEPDMNIEHIALNVPDPVAMAEWYTRSLGMRVVRSFDNATHTHFIGDESGRVVLEMYRHESAPVPDYFAMDPMVLHIAFVTPQVEETRQRLLAAGATAVGETTLTPAGDQLAMLRDPWGVPVQLVRRARPLTGVC